MVETVKLADCVTLTKGKPPAEMPYYGDDAEPYLSPEYLRGNGTTEAAKPAANAVRMKDGDTILLWDGSNAGEVFRARAGLLASTMTHIRHGEEFEPEYFCYAVKRWEAYLKGQTSGSGIPHVDKEMLGKLEILKLPPDEQRLVAKILSKLDRAIEQTEALITKQQRIKVGLMQDLLTKGIDEHGNIRSEATHAFKNSPLGRIPVEWDVQPLGMVARQVTSGSRGWARYYSNEGAIFLRIGNLTREHINLRLEDLVYVQVAESSEGQRTAVQEGDLLISITADLGIIGVIPTDFGEAYVNQHIALVRLDSEVAYPRFVGHLLSGQFGRSQIDSLNESGAKAGLNLPTVEKLLIATPKMNEQVRIAETLDATDKQIKSYKSQLKKLGHEKAGLMHDLLTGERRVTPLLAQAPTP
jgi:type I restriction enzyme S subunit